MGSSVWRTPVRWGKAEPVAVGKRVISCLRAACERNAKCRTTAASVISVHATTGTSTPPRRRAVKKDAATVSTATTGTPNSVSVKVVSPRRGTHGPKPQPAVPMMCGRTHGAKPLVEALPGPAGDGGIVLAVFPAVAPGGQPGVDHFLAQARGV